ncbi:hypothetical protein BDV95DRAFT_639984, partial [Massariosphaeria phaeospora]
DRCFYRLGLVVAPLIWLGHWLLDTRQQIRSLHAYQVRQLLRSIYPRVDLVALARLDGANRSLLDSLLRLGYCLAHTRPCCLAVDRYYS